MKLLCDCSSLERFAQLRSKVLINIFVKSNSFVVSDNLPPTKAGTKFHSFRVYFQIMLWSGTPLGNPEKLGWYKKDGKLYPVLPDVSATPQYLLNIIHCVCKTVCVTFCCQYKKNGLT